MSNVDACKLKQTKKQSNTLMQVYLVLSIRRAMETLINASRRTKITRACIPGSKHQMSNGDACKLKQTKN